MSLSTTKIDVNRTTTGVALPSVLLNQVLQGISEGSAVMQLANRLTIPGAGVTMNVITGDPEPAWVSPETAEKTVSKPSLASKVMQPYKLAVIVPFSDEFSRDESALYDAIVARIPNALARKFDATVFGTTAPGTNFDTLGGADAVDISTDAYDAIVGTMTAVAQAGGNVTGAVLSPQGNGEIMTARNASGELEFPGFAPNGGMLGIPTITSSAAYATGTPNTLGFIGDWSRAYYGIVEDVRIDISNQATLNDGTNSINLWQRNMFAVRAEMEVGFVVQDVDFFNKLTDNASV